MFHIQETTDAFSKILGNGRGLAPSPLQTGDQQSRKQYLQKLLHDIAKGQHQEAYDALQLPDDFWHSPIRNALFSYYLARQPAQNQYLAANIEKTLNVALSDYLSTQNDLQERALSEWPIPPTPTPDSFAGAAHLAWRSTIASCLANVCRQPDVSQVLIERVAEQAGRALTSEVRDKAVSILQAPGQWDIICQRMCMYEGDKLWSQVKCDALWMEFSRAVGNRFLHL
jgi:hypothetical protein